MELLGISFGFPFFDFQPLKARHSLHLGTESDMTTPGGAVAVSIVRPWTNLRFLSSANQGPYNL